MWLTTTEFRNKFNITQNAFGNQIASTDVIAKLSIREVVGSEVYTEAESATLDPANANYVRQQKVVQSEAYLTYYYLLCDAGLKFSPDGLIAEAQDAANVEGARVVTNKYLTPEQLETLKNDALSKAKFWLYPYGTLLVGEDVTVAIQNTLVSTLKYF